MRVHQGVLLAFLATTSIGPALADGAKPTTAMGAGEIIAVMPDGHMARETLTDAAKMDALKKMVKPIPWCMMFMLGTDGNVCMINTSTHQPMVACENMVQ